MARSGASTLILLAALGGGGLWAYTKYGASLGLTGPADPNKPAGSPGGPAGPPRPVPAPAGPPRPAPAPGAGGASGGTYGSPSDPDYDPALDPTINRQPTGADLTSAWVDLGVGGVAPGLAWSSADGNVYNIDGAVMVGGPFSTVWEAQSFGRSWLGLGDWSPGVE